MQSQKKYRTIDLFAGIGGIRLGFEQGFGLGRIDTVFASDFDNNAQKTYKANFSFPEIIAGDINNINASDVPEFDICLSGFPCVAFSMAGKRMGFADDYKGMSRGTLFFEMMRICEAHNPKVIFCENVKGLPIHDHGKTLEVILGRFNELGYKTFYKVLNSKNFGVPQNRERIYIVAFRNDIAPEEFIFPEGNDNSATIRDILDPAPIPSKYYLSDTYVTSLKAHRARNEAKGNSFGYVIRDLDSISGTIMCGGMGHERNLLIDHRSHSMTPTTNIRGNINTDDWRKMTPREWARLQGFPETFDFPLSDSATYKQLGNSVTVPVIEAIASNISDVLAETDK